MRNLPLEGWEWAAALTSWLGYVGVLIAAGGAFFLAFVHDGRPDERRLITVVVVAAAILGVVARVLAEPVRAIEVSGQGAQAAADPRAYAVTLTSPDGVGGLVRLVGLSIVMVAIVRRSSGRAPIVAVIGGVVALTSASMAGHTVTGEPQWLVRSADVVHMLAAAVWFGGLVLFGLILRRRWGRSDAVQSAGLVARFSGLATVALALVLVAGLSMAWAEIRTLDSLVENEYGIVLLLKTALVVAVAGIGAYNNRWLVPAIADGSSTGTDDDRRVRAWHRLSRTVRREVIALVVVLAITGVLVHVAPPRPQTEEPHDAVPLGTAAVPADGGHAAVGTVDGNPTLIRW